MDNYNPSDALASAMATLTQTFTKSTELENTLHTLTATAVDLIPGADSADVLLVSGPDDFQSLAATSQLAVDIDGLQRRFGGPCVEAASGNAVVKCNYLRDDGRWPALSESAVAAGVSSILSFQLPTHNARRGALNLFGCRPDVFDAGAEAVGVMLASHAAIALVLHDKEDQFRAGLASRDVIGQAKGMIMERFGIDAVRAFELLKRLSQNSNTRVADVAAQIIAQRSPKSTPPQ